MRRNPTPNSNEYNYVRKSGLSTLEHEALLNGLLWYLSISFDYRGLFNIYFPCGTIWSCE